MLKQVVAIKKKVTLLNKQLLEIQSNCQHENIVGEYKGDTGNWCQQDDSYWITAVCQDCEKSLYADSDKHKHLYYKYSMSGMIK